MILCLIYRPSLAKWLALADLAGMISVVLFLAHQDRTAIPELQIVNDSGQAITRIAMTCGSGADCADDDLLDGGRLSVGGSLLFPVPNATKVGCNRAFSARLEDDTTVSVDRVDVCAGTLHVRFTPAP